jgi:hypothetical protein
MRTANRIFAALAGLLLTLFGVGFLLPSHWHAEATIVVQRAPENIYPYIASFKNGWVQWSPFGLASDPGLHMTYHGPNEGVGASQHWTASKTGDGQMTITQADPHAGIKYDMIMVNGFNLAGEIRMSPQGDGTQLVWTDEGEFAGPFGRYVALLMPSMLSTSLQRGLGTLKSQAEQH